MTDWDIIDGYEVATPEAFAESARRWPAYPPLTGPILVEALQRAGIEPDDWNNHDSTGWEHEVMTTRESRFMYTYHPDTEQWEVTRSTKWKRTQPTNPTG